MDFLPFPSTLDKLSECQYFLAMMLQNYHEPTPFRFNLNAFIQALRNVSFMLQSEDLKPDGFDAWYESKQSEMRQNALLRNFVGARNLLVKQQMLDAKSECWMGLYRGRRLKLAIGGEVPPQIPSIEHLERTKAFAIGFYLDEEHSAIGEQIGVGRKWIVEALGAEEVVGLCAQALEQVGLLVAEAVRMAGGEFDPKVTLPSLDLYTVLLESDIDPSIPEKWGW